MIWKKNVDVNDNPFWCCLLPSAFFLIVAPIAFLINEQGTTFTQKLADLLLFLMTANFFFGFYWSAVEDKPFLWKIVTGVLLIILSVLFAITGINDGDFELVIPTLVLGLIFLLVGLFALRKLRKEPREPDEQFLVQKLGLPLQKDLGNLPGMEADPVCPQCGTVYNRSAVIRELKKITPETFLFAFWTTKFICTQCRTQIGISGTGGEWIASKVILF